MGGGFVLPNTLKHRTSEELDKAIVIPIFAFTEPPYGPDQITFPWKGFVGNQNCRIQVYDDDFEIFQQWDPWFINLGIFGCIGSCLLSPFARRTQGLRHAKADIVKLEFGPYRQAKLVQIVKRKPEPVCRLYVKADFDPNLIAPVQGEKLIKYVFWLGEIDRGTEETRRRLDELVKPELQSHVEQ
jgi:hypothetical protein